MWVIENYDISQIVAYAYNCVYKWNPVDKVDFRSSWWFGANVDPASMWWHHLVVSCIANVSENLGLFNDNRGYVTSNRSMICEWLMEKDVEGSSWILF